MTVIGMSPVRFIQEVRLQQATFLLRTTNQTPKAIATASATRTPACYGPWSADGATPRWPP